MGLAVNLQNNARCCEKVGETNISRSRRSILCKMCKKFDILHVFPDILLAIDSMTNGNRKKSSGVSTSTAPPLGRSIL